MESTTYSRVVGFTARRLARLSTTTPSVRRHKTQLSQTRGLASLLGWKGVKEESCVDAEEAALDALCRSLVLNIQ